MKPNAFLINKGVNRPIEFRGLKGRWIWRLGAGLVAILLGFAILYLTGVNPWVCIAVVGAAGTGLFVRVYQLSRQYGEYGWMKKMAARQLPRLIHSGTRTIFRHDLWKKN
jgi:uncharacterized membrane protein HdeD (DUF308 family)